MSGIDVSVVMSVYNGAQALAATLDSVLGQQGCGFEFIVVDDGSTDGTPGILADRAARDARLRVIRQDNTGLTGALARGCADARGGYIARQDCGDLSLPGRLAGQLRMLREHPHAVMVACAVRFVGPGHEPLFVLARPGTQLHEGLCASDLRALKGPPHHGGTMFSRAAYLKAGGYRPVFPVAQDIDLWLRLSELGQCLGQPELGYAATMEVGSISARRRSEQVRFAALAIECARRRREGHDDAAVLGRHIARPATGPGRSQKLEHARFLYFIGCCLRDSDPTAARRYFWQAFRAHPLLVKSLFRLALG